MSFLQLEGVPLSKCKIINFYFVHVNYCCLCMLPCSISLEQKKAMSRDIDTLKSLLEKKTSTYITITSCICV